LGDLLRYSLRIQRESIDEVPLREECAFVESYLALERLRLADRLRVNVDTPPNDAGMSGPDVCRSNPGGERDSARDCSARIWRALANPRTRDRRTAARGGEGRRRRKGGYALRRIADGPAAFERAPRRALWERRKAHGSQ